jgi:acetate kinase
MVILTVNTGSSSVRLETFSAEEGGAEALSPIHSGHLAPREGEPEAMLRGFLQEHATPAIALVAHRVVHGGMRFKEPCFLDEETERAIGELADLAPLHNPVALRWICACRKVLGPEVPQIAVFDTAFFARLPEVAATYALPRDLCRRHGIQRFGFHGLAHQSMWRRWRQLRPEVEDGGRVISLQLGSGSSMAAVARGEPKDTSMGFSPLEGLVMATRCGDVDAGLLTYLQRAESLSAAALEELLNRSSGLLGVSGLSSDMRELLASDAPAARLAVDLYCYRARKYLGSYLAVLGGVDAVLFGGGVGEHAAVVRERILSGLEWCGILLDSELNHGTSGQEGRISAPDSKTEVWVLPVDEAVILAQEAVALLGHR